jgi:hypothetical protein
MADQSWDDFLGDEPFEEGDELPEGDDEDENHLADETFDQNKEETDKLLNVLFAAIGNKSVDEVFEAVEEKALYDEVTDAIENDKVEDLQKILDRGVSPDTVVGGMPLILYCAGGKSIKCLELLLERGADFDYSVDAHRDIIEHFEIDYKELEMFVKKGFDVTLNDNALMKQLLEGLDYLEIDEKNTTGLIYLDRKPVLDSNFPLEKIQSDFISLVRLIIRHGADASLVRTKFSKIESIRSLIPEAYE